MQTTPVIEQYIRIKANHQDSLLFFRMGDFYELFFEDAIVASEALDITLTKRGKSNGKDIPMCGVPFHSADNYLPKLIKKGFNVAVCEQTETAEEAKIKLKKGTEAIILLDEKGEKVTTEKFKHLLFGTSFSKILFVLGGTEGFSEEIRNLSNKQISLSKMMKR